MLWLVATKPMIDIATINKVEIKKGRLKKEKTSKKRNTKIKYLSSTSVYLLRYIPLAILNV